VVFGLIVALVAQCIISLGLAEVASSFPSSGVSSLIYLCYSTLIRSGAARGNITLFIFSHLKSIGDLQLF
jgi:hypothetical protein